MVLLSDFLSFYERPLNEICERLTFYSVQASKCTPIEFVGYTYIGSSCFYLFRFVSGTRYFCNALSESDVASSRVIGVRPRRAWHDWFESIFVI